MANNQYKEVIKYLNKYGKQVVAEQKTRLTSNAVRGTNYPKPGFAKGKLFKSLTYELDETELAISFVMEDYGMYVDKGVKPHPEYLQPRKKKSAKKSKFIEALKKWCKVKGLPEGMAFPIRRNIWKFGIKPTNFFTIPIKRTQKQFEAGLEKAMVIDLDNNLQKELNK